MLFTGHAELTIDAKQRLAIPSKYRGQWNSERDGSAWYSVPWPDGSLRLYTEKRFEALAEQGEQSLTPGHDEAALESQLFGFAERIEMDSAGRITVPRSHLELAGLSSEVVMVGARNRLEVRDRSKWNQSLGERFAQLPALVARIEAKRAGPG